MDEIQFKKTMIEMIKYDDYDRKNELLTVLRNSMIKFNKTTLFTKKSNQFYENIDLRVPIPLLKEARLLQSVFEKIISVVYIESDEYGFGDLEIKPKPVEGEDFVEVEHDVLFDQIKETIIQGIRSADYLIWIAVAWFTDADILRELQSRKKAGVSIRIITSDEKSNQYIINDLEEHFELIKVPLRGRYFSNRLHDKFCIIDLEYVMHGSYNWSNNARENDETLATALDKDFVKKFADEFMKLYNEYK